MLKEYEITYWANAALNEEKRDQLNGDVDALVADIKGEMVSNTKGQRQRLSYPINKLNSGFLRVMQVSAETENVEKLHEALRKMEDVLRFTIIQTKLREGLKLEKLTASVQDAVKSDTRVTTKEETAEKKPEIKLTEEELEEKIEAALDEKIN